MSNYTMHRCDNCGRTSENRDGWLKVAVSDSPYSIGGGYLRYACLPDPHIHLEADLCSWACVSTYGSEKAPAEYESIKTERAKRDTKKGKK